MEELKQQAWRSGACLARGSPEERPSGRSGTQGMLRPHVPTSTIVAALLVCMGGADRLSAQTLSGILVDEGTLEGVEGATIALLDSGRSPISSTLTDAAGAFSFTVASFGAYFIRAQHLAYGEVSSQSFNVSGVETDTVALIFYVTPQAIVLEPIYLGIPSVVGSEVFEQRRTTGAGIFFTPEMIDSIRPTQHVGEIFSHVEDDLFMSWGWGLREIGGYGPLPNIHSFRGAGCLNYIVDRTPVPAPFFQSGGNPWSVSPLAELEPKDLVAVEVYRGWWEVPKDYEKQILANTLGTRRKLRDIRLGECGIVVIWTDKGWGTERLPS
jgi:hypothetical protein